MADPPVGAVTERGSQSATFLIDAERVDESLDRLIADDDDVAIAAIAVAELHVGVQLATANDIMGSIPVLAYYEGVAVEHADLLVAVRRSGRPRGPTTSSSPPRDGHTGGLW